MIKIKWLILFIFTVLLILGGGLYYCKYLKILPNTAETYYTIFDKNKILNGNETSAIEVDKKLDKRLAKYKKTWIKITGTQDPYKLKALFYMNFVHMYGIYGNRELENYTLKDLLWDSENFHCGTNTLLLSMLLDKTNNYEFRTVSLNDNDHGFVEIKFDGRWQILDPTINIWIDKSAEELIVGQLRTEKMFFLKGGDQLNEKAQVEAFRVISIRNFMLKLGIGQRGKIDQYNYIDLSQYQY